MLTDAEIEELDRFLLDAEGTDESMDVSMLDGCFDAGRLLRRADVGPGDDPPR